MACGRTTFILKQGETFYRRIVYLDSNNLPVDLTDYHGRLQMRPSAGSTTIYASLSSSLDADGTGLNFTPTSASVVLPKSSGSIGMTISAASASAFSFTEAVGDLFVYSGSGASIYSDHVLEIKFKLNKTTTTLSGQ